MPDDYEPMTSTDAVRMWELEQMSLPERIPPTLGLTVYDALGRLHHGCEESDRREGMCDETANMCRDIVLDRIADLEAALAAEKHTARLNAEGHTREIRGLQDMLEAEVEARREAEGEVERLRADQRAMLLQVGEHARARGEAEGALWISEKVGIVEGWRDRALAAEAELAGWKRVAVEAAIPLEAIVSAGTQKFHSKDVRVGIEDAIAIIRRAVMNEGLPPAPPPKE